MLCSKVNSTIRKFSKILDCSIQTVLYAPDDTMHPLQCHSNCSSYNRVIGFYIVQDKSTGYYHALHHSVIRYRGHLIDITPNKFNLNRYIFFKPNVEIDLSYIRKDMRIPKFK